MAHSGRCAHAQGTECVCRCGGDLHGIGPTGKSWHLPKGYRYLCTPMGGEVEQKIEQFLDKKFKCTCGSTVRIKEFIGYPDNSGYSDKKGNKWRIYVKCPKCRKDWLVEKIPISTS